MRVPVPNIARAAFNVPLIRRMAWYARRARRQLDRRFFTWLGVGILAFVGIAALAVMLLEKPVTLDAYGDAFYWALTTAMGAGDAAFTTSPGGWLISWLLILLGVGLVGTATGALVAFIIDFLIKEGQGMGAAAYRDHIVVCGWNSTARDLVGELRGDEYTSRVVLIDPAERNPAGDGVYFVRGDASNEEDLLRAGIREAAAAIVFPKDGSDEADMHSILTVMAIEHVAPGVRTVVEVNNPRHEPHLRRARADEILVTSKLASHLLARSALYPGLTRLVTDIVSGGEGSELYRVALPESYTGLSIPELAVTLRTEHRATLMSVNRGGHAFVNPPADFRLVAGDDAIVLAESLGTLAPLQIRDAPEADAPRTAAIVPSA